MSIKLYAIMKSLDFVKWENNVNIFIQKKTALMTTVALWTAKEGIHNLADSLEPKVDADLAVPADLIIRHICASNQNWKKCRIISVIEWKNTHTWEEFIKPSGPQGRSA